MKHIYIGDYIFYADETCLTGQKAIENGLNYEKHVVEELRRLVPSSKGFLDIGANCGIHTIIAKFFNPSIVVVSVEASPFNVRWLTKNLKENSLDSSVIVIPSALADKPRIIWEGSHVDNLAMSLSGDSDSDTYRNTTAALSLDMLNLPDIDLIKIDIEGFEILALEGASKIMASNPVILFEYCPQLAHRSQVTELEFLQWFLDRNYKLVVLDYHPGMRAEFTNAKKTFQHIQNTSGWIADILALPK